MMPTKKQRNLIEMSAPDVESSNNAVQIPGLARQRLADQIADVLREQMLVGSLVPGSPIHERETAAALGVSRTPLREAVLILEAEGLVDTSPARSPIVANPSLEELTNLLIVQCTLEGLAGELACLNATDDEISAIRGYYETMVQTNDSPNTVEFFRTDMTFHESIVQASRNQPLIKTHKQYNTRLWRARYMSSRSRLGRINTMRDHAEMLGGLEARDGARIAAVMREHLTAAIINVTKIKTEEIQIQKS
jgi:DNA-binding GntR family transcriptional regulator